MSSRQPRFPEREHVWDVQVRDRVEDKPSQEIPRRMDRPGHFCGVERIQLQIEEVAGLNRIVLVESPGESGTVLLIYVSPVARFPDLVGVWPRCQFR